MGTVSNVDPDEYQIRLQELRLKQAEYEQKERTFSWQQADAKRSGRTARRSVFIAAVSVVLTTTLTVVITGNYYEKQVKNSQDQLATSQRQFVTSAQATEYNDIIQGLASDSGAVQTISLRRLVAYVSKADHFWSPSGFDGKAQHAARIDAVQGIQAFIKDKAAYSDQGLHAFLAPEPDVVLKALAQLRTLIEDERAAGAVVDLGHADLKGAPIAGITPRTNVYAAAVDLRMAAMSQADFSHATLTLRNAFLTCADLRNVNFGNADLTFADLTGSDLRGANLGHVRRGFTSRQIAHALVDDKTTYPKSGANMEVPTDPWQAVEGQCTAVVKRMTGMQPGEGFNPAVPCSDDSRAPHAVEVCLRRE